MASPTEAKIQQLYQDSIRTKEENTRKILSLVLSELKMKLVEKVREPLTEDEVLAVLRGFIKRGNDSLDQYKKSGREDLAKEEQAQLQIIEALLPPQISDEELEKEIKTIVASGTTNFGQIIQQIMAKYKNQVDGAKVSAIIKNVLAQSNS